MQWRTVPFDSGIRCKVNYQCRRAIWYYPSPVRMYSSLSVRPFLWLDAATVTVREREQSAEWIWGPKREEVAGGWKRLHNGELHNLYASSNITGVITSRRMRWKGHVARMGDIRNAYRIVWKSDVKRPLRRARNRWEDIRMDLREIGSESVDWIHLAQDRDK